MRHVATRPGLRVRPRILAVGTLALALALLAPLVGAWLSSDNDPGRAADRATVTPRSPVGVTQQRAGRSPQAAAPLAAPSPVITPGGRVHVVGLGDSVPAGSACDCTSYVDLVGRTWASGMGGSAEVSNLAFPGLTTGGLLQQLDIPLVRTAVARADLLIVTIGANDFDVSQVTSDSCAPEANLGCYRPALALLRTDLVEVLARLHALQGDRHGVIVLTGYWNVFRDGQVGQAQGTTYLRASRALTQEANTVISQVAGDGGARYADLHQAFQDSSEDWTDLLAPDGDHPSAAGHQLIAQAVLAALRA